MPGSFIASERLIAGINLLGNGNALALASVRLGRMAAAARVCPLMDFFSMEPEQDGSIDWRGADR